MVWCTAGSDFAESSSVSMMSSAKSVIGWGSPPVDIPLMVLWDLIFSAGATLPMKK